MNEMIERVACAIAESQQGRNWDSMMEHGKEWWRIEARAAIAAMREPTKHMLDAGMIHCGVDLASEYRAMIDAALGDAK